MGRILFVTGTGTGVGKTVFTALLTRHLASRGVRVAALKPICSGGRGDARWLAKASGSAIPIEEVNPWAFSAQLSPLLAARREQRSVAREAVVMRVRDVAARFEVVLVEGAGGLLSPLGEDLDARELIRALSADVVFVGANRLGVLNDVLLGLEALGPVVRREARVVLMNPRRSSVLSRTNVGFLRDRTTPKSIHEVPFLKDWRTLITHDLPRRLAVLMDRIVA